MFITRAFFGYIETLRLYAQIKSLDADEESEFLYFQFRYYYKPNAGS